MLIDTAILAFAVSLAFLYFFSRKKDEETIFTLKNLFFLFAAAEIPYLIYLNHNQDLIHEFVKIHIYDYDGAFLKHLYLKLVFILSAIVGMEVLAGKVIPNKFFSVSGYSKNEFLFFSLVFLLAAGLFYFLFLQKVGGLLYLLANWSNKTLVVMGTGLYRNAYFVASLLSIGFFVAFLSRIGEIKISHKIIFSCIALFLFLILISTGERKNPILLILYLVAMWNYKINKIRVLTFWNVVGFLLVAFLAATFPVLRQENAFELYMSSPVDLLTDSVVHLGEIFKRFSEIDISLFIYSYFDSWDKFWYGKTFGDLLTGFIPMSLYDEKPPVDEGVYIYALAHNYTVDPPVPFYKLTPVGWPLSRVTGGYVHFGMIGVIVSGFLVGLILKFVYASFIGSSYSPFVGVLFISMIASGFGLTNAFIFNYFIIFIILSVLSIVCKINIRSGSGVKRLN